MRRLIVVVAALCLCPTADAITRTWDGGGGNLFWMTAANWNPDGLPQPSDDVVIDVPGLISVKFNGGTSTIQSLTCTESLQLISGTLTINGASTIHNFTPTPGALAGSGDITVDGTLTGPGNMSGTGHTIIAPGGVLTLGGGPLKRVLDNYGTASWQFNNMTYSGGPSVSVFNNYGVLNVIWDDVNSILSMVGVVGSGGGVLNNFGTINKSGIGRAGCQGAPDSVEFNNTGTVNVFDGMWVMANGFHSGTFNLSGAGATRLFVGGLLPAQFGPTAQIQGPSNIRVRMDNYLAQCDFFCPLAMTGNIDLAGGTIGFHGDVAMSGTISIIESDLSIVTFDGPTVTAPNIQVTPGNCVLSFDSPTSTVGTLNMAGGELSGSGDLYVTKSMMWGSPTIFSGGTMSGSGRTIIESTATLIMPFVSGTGQRKLQRVLENHGEAAMETGSATIALAMADGEVHNLGTFTITTTSGSPAQIQRTGGTATIDNEGTLVISGPGILQLTSANGGVPMNNSGTVNVTQGELWLNGSGSNSGAISVSNGATTRFLSSFEHLAGSLLDGNGTQRFDLGTHDILGGVGSGVQFYNAGATVTIHEPISPASVTLSGTTIVEADQTWPSLVAFTGSTIDGSATLTISGTASVFGAMKGAGQTIITPTGTMNVSGQPVLKRTLINNGLLNWTIDKWDFTDGILINNGVFNVSPFNVLFPCRIRALGGNNQCVNNGIVNKDNIGLMDFQVVGGSLVFDNHSTVNVNQGLMQIGCDGTGDGVVNVDPGASLKITKDFLGGSVDVNGALTLTAGAQLTLSQSFAQSNSGLLQLAFNSANRPAIICGGNISLAGAISASFSPSPPAFTIVSLLASSSGDVAGAFSSIAFSPPGTIQYAKDAVTWTTFKPGDVNGDNAVNSTDLLAIINAWGNCPAPPAGCPADQNVDVVVNSADLLIVINNWG